MKAEIVNAFISASLQVMNNFAPSAFQVGKPFRRTSVTYPTNDVVIILGITGDIKGQAALSFTSDLAKSMASSMMMGMEVKELDEMSKSALSELGNMVMGNSATLLFNQGVKIDITPPSLLTGTSIEISPGEMETICVPLESSPGNIEFDIGLVKEK